MSVKGSFQAGLNAFKQEVRKETDRNVRKVLLAGLSGCISRSPVDTGSFRLNWTIQAKSPNPEYDETKAGKSGNSPRPASVDEVAPAETVPYDLGDLIYISNALPYANFLEGGRSEQAPGGVVAPTIRELESKIAKGALD